MAELAVRGLTDLTRTFNNAPKDVKRAYRAELRGIAEPVRGDAERLTTARIPRIGTSWSRMRTGVTQKSVYVAPRQRGVKGRGFDQRRRPNLAGLLAERALEPALEQNRFRIEHDFDRMLDRLTRKWDHG